MAKKIAIIVRDRKQEALRMGVGATLSNDKVGVFVMSGKLESDEEIEVNLQMLSDLNVEIFTDCADNPFIQKSTEEIAVMLKEYDL
nr:hypothetical protein [bacterium]